MNKNMKFLAATLAVSFTMLQSPLKAEAACFPIIRCIPYTGCPASNCPASSCPAEYYEQICGTRFDLREILNQLTDFSQGLEISCKVKECPEKQENPVVQETPTVQEAPTVQDTPTVQEAPTVQETPTVQDTPSVVPAETNSQQNSGYDQNVLRIAELVNIERTKAGLAPVTIDKAAVNAAQIRARETKTYFSHTRPDGRSCFSVLTDLGISYRRAGENIAYGQRTPEEVMKGWMNSSGHRANILNPNYTKIGIGYYVGSDGVKYWTQMFLS